MPEFKAPAKINLGLEVGSVREDGYHSVETFMQTIRIFDSVIVEPSEKFIFTSDNYDFPLNEENLCTKAYRMLSELLGIDDPVHINLTKRIPVGAGLGGGSSDAATVLIALNDIWKSGLQTSELSAVGAKIGSDVPFFIEAVGGSAFCSGRGEIIEPHPPLFSGHVIVIFNGEKISTKQAYKNIDENLTNCQKSLTLKLHYLGE